MKLSSLILILTTISFVSTDVPKITTPVNSINRPVIHLTPPYGWMNDPNGLWYDEKDSLWHVYYQFNPNATHWNLPLYWGHATSPDGLNWNHTGVAVAPYDKKSGAYSGSCVVDDENTSGFFSGATELDKSKRVIAIWTFNHYPSWAESQYISYSIDGGVSFKDYRMNPVASINSTQYRDPQVIKYVNGNDKWWVMSVAKSHQYRIQFYKSNNLKNWKRTSYFELYGLLGYQYECPNLAKIRYEGNTSDWKTPADKNDGYLWVLFISINPGSLQGGSSTEYFIGTFDGLAFTPIKNYAAPIDYGKDFYALQVFFNSPKDGDNSQVHAIAWTSNWQYCATVPTDNWRSSMSLIRKLQLTDFESAPGTKIAFIKSTPLINNENLRFGSTASFDSTTTKLDYFHPKHTIDFSDSLNGVIKFTLTWTVTNGQWTKSNPANFYLDFKGYALPDEYLRIGYQAEAGAFFVDRGNTNVEWVHTNRFFTDKISVNVQPNSDGSYSVNGIIDRNIIELYFGEGFQVLTNTFFMTGGNFIGSVDVSLDMIAYDFDKNQYCEPFTLKLEAQQILDANNS